MVEKEQKKELLVNILKAIDSYRDLAEWFLTIVENTKDDNLINNILIEIQNWIKLIKSQRKRENIKKEINNIYEKYNNKTEQDKEKAEEFLENFINNI